MRGFLDAYKYKTFEVDGAPFPTVLLGTSPFIGAGQFKERAAHYYHTFYQKRENMTRLFVHSIERGCNAFQLIPSPNVLASAREAVERTGVEAFIFGTVGLDDPLREAKALLELGARCIVAHAALSDRSLARTRERLELIRGMDGGLVTGISTHLPGVTIEKALGMKEVQLILAPVNSLGWFMEPSFEAALEGMAKARGKGRRIVGMKTLAAGKLKPAEASEFLRGIVDGVTVGLTSTSEIDETLPMLGRIFD